MRPPRPSPASDVAVAGIPIRPDGAAMFVRRRDDRQHERLGRRFPGLREGIGEDELQRCVARAKSSLIMQQESSSARSSSLARDWFHLGQARTLDEVGRLVDQLTPQSINNYLAANPPRDFTIVTLGPSPLAIPA